jgi:hypothetical protein
VEQVEQRGSKKDPNYQLSEHRWLPQLDGEVSCHFGGEEDDDEQDGELKKSGHVHLFYYRLA